MRRFIAIENIVYFKRELEFETDPKRRAILRRLQAEEEAVLTSQHPRLSAAVSRPVHDPCADASEPRVPQRVCNTRFR